MTPELISIIKEKLRVQWSPVQISGWLKKQGKSISHEIIYQYIWEEKKGLVQCQVTLFDKKVLPDFEPGSLI